MQSIVNCASDTLISRDIIKAEPINIQWDLSMPVFAKREFLSAVGDEYGWLGGIDDHGALRCILPFTILQKAGLRMVRFRSATIPQGSLDINEEKSFLNSVVQHFRSIRVDVIIPASNNAIFRTFPDGADAAPYGTYVIDLQQQEDILWKNIARKTRQNINSARKAGVRVREEIGLLGNAYDLIRDTFRRSKLPFMSRGAFERFTGGLGEHGKLLAAEQQGVVQSYCLFGFSNTTVYAIYAGNLPRQVPGANKLLYWEAMRLFRALGVHKFDFYGARINPEKGSKQEGINFLKELMGGTLSRGYMWKYSLRRSRALFYSVGVHVLRGGDIVDRESCRLNECK